MVPHVSVVLVVTVCLMSFVMPTSVPLRPGGHIGPTAPPALSEENPTTDFGRCRRSAPVD
jgi:hypothetical protein